MILFTGKLNRTNYWKNLILGALVFIPVSLLLLWLVDIQNAEVPGASITNQTLSIIFFMLYIASALCFLAFLISVILRRARDAGNVVLWTLVALLVPFGGIVLGLIPSRK